MWSNANNVVVMQVMQTMQTQSNACNAAYLSGAASNAKVMHWKFKMA